jgi:hypothetical protein
VVQIVYRSLEKLTNMASSANQFFHPSGMGGYRSYSE